MRKSLIAAVSAIALTMPSAGLMAQTDADVGASTEAEIEAGADSGMDSGAGMDAETGVEADADMDAALEAESDVETDTDMPTEPPAESDGDELTALEIEAIVGMSVESRDGESVGEVEDVVTEADGQVVLISTGGLLGIGADTKAVSVADITFDEENEIAVLAMTEAEFEALADYEGEE